MKRLTAICLCLAVSGTALSQEVKDAAQALYYKKYQTAQQTLHKIISANPANAEAWYWLSQAYIQSGNTAGLRDSLSKAPEPVKNDPFYKVAWGALLQQGTHPDSATAFFEEALKETKQKNAAILTGIAQSHIDAKAGNATYALELLEKAGKREKKDPAIDVLMGDAHRKLGNGSEAYKKYMEAFNKDEKYAAASFQLGKIFVAQKNPQLYLKYFEDAVAADPNYTPALYELYYHYYFVDAAKAKSYFEQYVAKSDPSKENDYLYADLLYLGKDYQQAIVKTKQLIEADKEKASPRLYKLMAYSYLGNQDSATALAYMSQYLSKEADSNYVTKDFITIADLYAAKDGMEDSARLYYEKALQKNTDTTAQYAFYKKLADLNKTLKNNSQRALWMGKYYQGNSRATNLDLFNWGVAHYQAQEYAMADSVFGMYTTKYPEQGFGFYWRARSNVAIDTSMELGLAIPHYEQLIGILEKDSSLSATDKKWLVESYSYIAAHKTNVQKDYATAIQYLQKVLQVDPANQDAQKYITILEKTVNNKQTADKEASDTSKKETGDDGKTASTDEAKKQ